jgi:hypothetical protein
MEGNRDFFFFFFSSKVKGDFIVKDRVSNAQFVYFFCGFNSFSFLSYLIIKINCQLYISLK